MPGKRAWPVRLFRPRPAPATVPATVPTAVGPRPAAGARAHAPARRAALTGTRLRTVIARETCVNVT